MPRRVSRARIDVVKAVVLHVPEEEIALRRRLGLDGRDEMWEGVLHMSPAPAPEHQRMLDELIAFLMPLFKRSGRGTLRSGINVFDESSKRENYRIPDLTFVAAGRERIIAQDGVRGEAPDAVIEIRSPDDETYEKLPFYASLGVREVVVLDRDTKKPEVFRLAGGRYVVAAPDREGWIPSDTLLVRFRHVPGPSPRVAVRDERDPAAHVEI